MNRRDLHYNSDVAAVKAVQFGIKSPEQIEKEAGDRTIFIIGGGEIYSNFISKCEELFITEVQQFIKDGDVFFPTFKNQFEFVENLEENDQFILGRWIRKK